MLGKNVLTAKPTSFHYRKVQGETLAIPVLVFKNVMDIFTHHLFDWIMALGLIVAAFYTLRVIGQEKSTFKDECYKVQFGTFELTIPNWWTITDQAPFHLYFERTDTRYDWFCRFAYIPDHKRKNLPDLLSDKLDLEKIEFDQDVVFETDSRVLFRDTAVQEYFQEVIRVEGKASQNIEDRIYYDIYIMRVQDDAGYFIFESRSSVLNGLVEGPYFEESLAELSFIREPEPR
jgi:hypothetical protein